MILTHGHLGKFKVTGRKSAKYMFGQYLFMENHWKFLVQGQWKEKCKIRVQSISFLWKNI